MADIIHLTGQDLADAIREIGAAEFNAVRERFPDWAPDLRGTSLAWANLAGFDLSRAYMVGTNLTNANLCQSNLYVARLYTAKLTGADLRGADLTGAGLTGADIRRAVGNGYEIRSLRASPYTVVWTNTVMAIGCQQHQIADWWAFSDDRIDSMDSHALHWWREWKPKLRILLG